jgi:hypothetical protein
MKLDLKLLADAQRICPEFDFSSQLEVDRRLIAWWQRNWDRGIMIEDSLLCQILGITKEQYWLSVARLHYLGVMHFPMDTFSNTPLAK